MRASIPIHILTPAQMAVSGCPVGSIGCTRHAGSSINVVAVATTSPVSFAVVLSHELTHCRLHDKTLGMAVPSGWSRLLWRNEESRPTSLDLPRRALCAYRFRAALSPRGGSTILFGSGRPRRWLSQV